MPACRCVHIAENLLAFSSRRHRERNLIQTRAGFRFGGAKAVGAVFGLIPKLADPDSCRCQPAGTSIAKRYGGPTGYRHRAQARTVPRMSQCLRSLV
jgi:hypothetical protein